MTRLLSHRYALRLAVAALVLAGLAYGVLAHPSSARPLAPPLPTLVLRGPATTLARLRGHAAVIVFFASWCTDCRREAPAVARFARSPAGHDRVVAVDYDDGGNAPGFVRRYRWDFPVLDDSSGRVGAAFHIPVLPTAVFIDPQGRIASSSSIPQTFASLAHGLAAAA